MIPSTLENHASHMQLQASRPTALSRRRSQTNRSRNENHPGVSARNLFLIVASLYPMGFKDAFGTPHKALLSLSVGNGVLRQRVCAGTYYSIFVTSSLSMRRAS